MRKAFAIFAILALAGLFAGAQSTETERVNQTLSLNPGGTLKLKSFSGRVTITAVDRSEVVIDALRRADRRRLDSIKLEIRKDGDTVFIEANRREWSWYAWGNNNVVETDFDIKVPRRTNLEIQVFSAPVTVTGVEGSHDVHAFSSRVRLDDVAGSVQAKTFSGPVTISARTWLDRQTIDVDTFSGDVELHVPDNARGTLTFNSFSGRLNSDMPLTLQSSGRRSVRAELGTGGSSSLRFKTFSGSVRINR
jgi:hypothetical protein